ncbi:MAG TPA: hypothetical protein VGQ85_07460 [Candidatus Limnocylindrales bacterium]|nr:hypothetical protein [Candidatus Limnocylindrales bacterium]
MKVRAQWPGRTTAAAVVIAAAAAIVMACGTSLGTPVAGSPSSSAAVTPTSSTPIASLPSLVASPDSGRDPTGIPTTLDGQPVDIGLAAVVHALATTDATPFIVGGWFNDAKAYTCSGGIDRDPSPLLRGCATVVGGDSPWGQSFPGPQGLMYWDGHELPGRFGPSIVKVHTHDRRAAACRLEDRAQCRGVLVVDDVLWTGDEWTTTGPLSVTQAVGRLDGLSIITGFPMGPNGSLSVQRKLFTTPTAQACPSPWPHEAFDLHGDPRFGVLAVFPNEAARIAAQAQLAPAAPGCGDDPRVVRPDAAAWVGVQNVLVRVYGAGVAAQLEGPLNGHPSDRYLPLPAASLDESYRVVDDAEAARASGNLGLPGLSTYREVDRYATYQQATYRRFAAHALTYAIGEGTPVTQANVDAATWAVLKVAAVPGTPRLYIVDHPDSTDPALRTEAIVAFEEVQPTLDTWGLIVLPSPQ